MFELGDISQIVHRILIGGPAFLLAIVCHEWAHAYAASLYGDDTAKMAGRLSLNPSVHIDPIGTVIFPLIGALAGWTLFGWARPVPIDPRRFKNFRQGVFWVAFAGPGMNILLAILSGFLMALASVKLPESVGWKGTAVKMLSSSVFINVILAVFNLIPFPPLDGSRMVSSLLSYENMRRYEELQRFSWIFILLIWFTPILSYIIGPAIMAGSMLVYFFQTLLA